jgi:lambda family phage portal protein
MFNWIFKNRSKEREGGVRSALWDAAGGGARLSNWSPASTSFLNNVPPDVLVRRAEDLHRNNPWARLAVDCLTHNTVQAGIKPHPQIADPAIRALVQRAWARWTDQTDFNGRHDFYGLEQAVLRSVVVSGEAIVRLVLAPDQRVPLQLQLLGREFLDNSRVDSRTLNGIRYDDAGRRVSYWLFQKHPANAPNMLSVEVPADQVIHVYAQDRPGQERGVPWLAPAMLPLRELQEYLEASLVKQKIAALMTAFITTQDGTNPLNGTPGQPPTLEPGAAVVLQPGQDVEIATPPPAADFEPFVRQQLRAIARALGIPYELLSGDVSQVTFASGRHSLLEFRRHLESIQDHILVHQFCRPVWLAWVRMATITGVLPGAAEQYADVRWICPQIEMLNPKDETQNMVAQVRAGFVSRSEMVARSGWDAEQIDAEIAADNARADRLGLVLDSDPRRTTVQGQSQQDQGGQQQ